MHIYYANMTLSSSFDVMHLMHIAIYIVKSSCLMVQDKLLSIGCIKGEIDDQKKKQETEKLLYQKNNEPEIHGDGLKTA